jgi:hypothetical protein
VTDAGAGGVEVDAVLSGEGLDLAVLAEILLARVLDVMVEREHRLCRVGHARRADPFELRHHGRCVVVSHHVVRSDREEVPGAQGAVRSFGHVRLSDLLDDSLTHGFFLPTTAVDS